MATEGGEVTKALKTVIERVKTASAARKPVSFVCVLVYK